MNQIGHGRASRILILDTWNTDVLDELKPQPTDLVIYKSRFNGFHGTELDAILESLGWVSRSADFIRAIAPSD